MTGPWVSPKGGPRCLIAKGRFERHTSTGTIGRARTGATIRGWRKTSVGSKGLSATCFQMPGPDYFVGGHLPLDLLDTP